MTISLTKVNLAILCAALLTLFSTSWALAQTPGKWGFAGGAPADYDMGGDPTVTHGSTGGGFIASKVPAPKDFGTMATGMAPGAFLGKRVRLSGFLRTEGVEASAFLWMGVYGPNNEPLGLDNMGNRPIKGTTEWKKYEVVLDVAPETTGIAYGFALNGPGRVWLDGVTLEIVGPEVPSTDRLASGVWSPTGGNPEDYAMGGNPMASHGAADGGYIRSKVAEPKTFGGLMDAIRATPLRGKRVRLSGHVRSEGVERWAGLWMRVDGPNGEVLSFDNMSTRPIKGTTDWKTYDVVLDVPPTAAMIAYGIILTGRGSAWLDEVTLGEVGTDVPVTQVVNPYSAYYAGNFADAAKLFPERIARTPASFSLRLFHFLSLHRSGQAKDARAYLDGLASSLTDRAWASPVVLFYAGKLSEDEVLKAAAHTDPTIDKQQKCEAYYYLGMAYLLNLGTVAGDDAARLAKAREYLEKTIATGVTNFVEYIAADAELKRMKK